MTGHSVGASMALLFAYFSNKEGEEKVKKVYAFAPLPIAKIDQHKLRNNASEDGCYDGLILYCIASGKIFDDGVVNGLSRDIVAEPVIGQFGSEWGFPPIRGVEILMGGPPWEEFVVKNKTFFDCGQLPHRDVPIAPDLIRQDSSIEHLRNTSIWYA